MELIKPDIEDTQRQQQQKKCLHVLAVDDSLLERKLLEKLLTISSYHVTCVESGDKALEYLGLLDSLRNDSSTTFPSSSSSSTHQAPSQHEGLKVNLIMTDYCMPGMSGYDLLKRVKGSSWKDIPVVVMSSENVPSRINMCLEEGAEEFLLKPVQLSDLKKLQHHLRHPLSHSCQVVDIEDENYVNNKNIDSNNDNNSNDNNNHDNKEMDNITSKRKAMSPEPSERRPKLKGLTVS